MEGIVNQLLECLISGIFTALFLVLVARLNQFPLVLLITNLKEDEDEQS